MRFSLNLILDEMSSAKCRLLYFIAQHEERPLYHVHMVISRFFIAQHEERPLHFSLFLLFTQIGTELNSIKKS